jgi:hypothetical protein
MGNYTAYNQPYYKKYANKDFINLSVPVNSTSPFGIISEAYFPTANKDIVNVKIIDISGSKWYCLWLQ